MIKFRLTIPKVNEKWWLTSKSELTKLVEDYNKENWASQTDPVTGAAWAPRKPPTGSWPILRKSGKMEETTKFSSSGPMQFTARTAVNYGGFHMTGTSKMPRRRWLGIGPDLTNDMEKVIARNIFKGRTTLRIP